MDDGIAGLLVDGIHLFPADVMEDQQVAGGLQNPFHLPDGLHFPPKVGEGIVTDQAIELIRGQGQVMDVRLHQNSAGLTCAGPFEHLVGEIQGSQGGLRVAPAQDRDQRAGACADFQNGAALAEEWVIGRQQVMQKLFAAGGLVVIPFHRQVFKELAE